MRTVAKDREQVRSRLLESAAGLFAERGLDGANVDDISTGAGYAKGTIYNYFRSKEELFAEVLAEACRRATARVAAVPAEGSVRDRLRALAEADAAVLREEEGFLKVAVREAMSFRPSTYPPIVEGLAPYRQAVERALREGRARGEVRTDLPLAELALQFVGYLTLLYVQYWGSGGTWPDLAHIPGLAVTLFLDGAAHGAP